jgi:phosphoribosylpyrophosphate synthetase
MKIGDKVRVTRFGKVGIIVEIQESLNNRDIYVVQYNKYESEGLYKWELELI